MSRPILKPSKDGVPILNENGAIQPLVVGKKGLCALGLGSVRHIERLLASGRFGPRPIRLGGKVVFDVEECRAWLKAGAPDRKSWDAFKEGRGHA